MGLGLDVIRLYSGGTDLDSVPSDPNLVLPKYYVRNFEELKAEIIKQTAPYKGLVISETDVSAAKTIRANLNKFSDALDGKRKEVKQELMDSMLPLEVKIKELVGLVVDAKMNIDNQVKAFEEAEKAEKKVQIKKWYNDNVPVDVIDDQFDTIFQARWLNRSVSGKEWQDDIEKSVAKLNEDLNHLIMIVADPAIKNIYRYNKNFQGTLNEWQRFKKLSEPKVEEVAKVEPITEKPSIVTEVVDEFKYHRITVEFTFEPSQMVEFKEMVNYIENTSIAYKIIGKDKI